MSWVESGAVKQNEWMAGCLKAHKQCLDTKENQQDGSKDIIPWKAVGWQQLINLMQHLAQRHL